MKNPTRLTAIFLALLSAPLIAAAVIHPKPSTTNPLAWSGNTFESSTIQFVISNPSMTEFHSNTFVAEPEK